MTDKKTVSRTIVSHVSDDGTIVETLFDPDGDATVLLVSQAGHSEIVSEWEYRGVVYRHVPSSNNLIRHRALLFPSLASNYGGETDLLDELQAYISRYVTLSDEDRHLATVYVLLTWLYDVFNEVPYLRFRGDYGTGKTRALVVIGSLCYKPFFASGASTVSPIFHTLDTFRGTLVFDEADFRFTDEKAELVKILNNGNARGFPVLRTQLTPKKEFDPRAFHVFGPKLVAMRGEYQDKALESRFLTLDMEPGRMAGSPISLPDTQAVEALELRNKLLSYRLRNRLVMALDPALADAALEPRMNQILLPLLTVAPSEEIRAAIRARARRMQSGIVVDRNRSTEGQLLSVLWQLSRQSDEECVALAPIVASFTELYAGEYERPITHRYIGGVIRRLGIALYKKHGVFVVAPGQDGQIEALCRRFGVVDEEGISDAF